MPSNKRKYRSKKLAQRKKQILIRKSILFGVLVILIITGLSYLSTLKFMKIERAIVEGGEYVSEDEISNIFFEEIEGKYLLLFSRSNILIYPRGIIKNRLYENYPSIKDIDLDIENFKTVSINVEEYSPHAKWCGDNQCYLLNEKGYVFVKEPLIHSEDFVTYKGAISENPLRETYVSEKDFKQLSDFNKLLRRLEIHVSEVNTDDSVVFNFITKSGTKIIIDIHDDVVDTFNNLQTVIDQDAINKAQFANIEYIDLRFGNRVFYRLK